MISIRRSCPVAVWKTRNNRAGWSSPSRVRSSSRLSIGSSKRPKGFAHLEHARASLATILFKLAVGAATCSSMLCSPSGIRHRVGNAAEVAAPQPDLDADGHVGRFEILQNAAEIL